ncbi:MAG: hypothetical protein N3D10_02160 [Candidatus Micrarchaeota archaeon]|nr:hypothetical protein [Candidatus Micrarchaeota archaeon]
MVDMLVRFGPSLRKLYLKVKKDKTSTYVCPKTGKKLKRVSFALWKSYAGILYAGGAYTPTTVAGETFDRMLKEYKEKT